MNYPTIVYKCPGQHQRPGGTYSYLGIDSEDELKVALSGGWHLTLEEAIEPNKAVRNDDPIESKPTRDEMNQKGAELGLKFDGRTSDKKLLKMIEDAINAVD